MQLAGETLVFGLGPEAGDAPPLSNVQPYAESAQSQTRSLGSRGGICRIHKCADSAFQGRVGLFSRHLHPDPFNPGEVLTVKSIAGLQSLG